MPLNATTYLEQHGWRGKGVPLDGESGRGLKKPLALPMKRNLKGVGKERDRAVEWWDCLFEAGAKKLQSSPSVTPPKEELISNDNSSVIKPKISSSSSISLASLAKREHARRLLMSGFVRGRPNEAYEKQVKDLEKTLAEQDQQRLAAKAKLVEQSILINGQNQSGETASLSEKDEEKAKRKEEKKLTKKLLKESLKKKDNKSKEEKDAKKKRKREEKAAVKSDVQKMTDKSSNEEEDRAEKRRRKEEKRKQKEEKKQKKATEEESSKKAQNSSVKADRESKKRKRSSKE